MRGCSPESCDAGAKQRFSTCQGAGCVLGAVPAELRGHGCTNSEAVGVEPLGVVSCSLKQFSRVLQAAVPDQ